MEKEPIVDEDELNDWINELESGGFTASVSIEEWHDYVYPKKVAITVSYKTGDGTDQPYSDRPPDEAVIESLEKEGWEVDAEGTMNYPSLMICERCGEVEAEDCHEEEVGVGYKHKQCGSSIIDYVSGNKWIHGHKTLELKGVETEAQIKQQIERIMTRLT